MQFGSSDKQSSQQQQAVPHDHHHDDLAHPHIKGNAPPAGVDHAKGHNTVVTDNHDHAFGE